MTEEELMEHLAAITAGQDKTLEAVKSLKLSDISPEDWEAIQKRELEIIFEIEKLGEYADKNV